MSNPPDVLESMLTCSVLFERYTESGPHVPVLLHCAHTMCLFCIEQIAKHSSEPSNVTSIICPECRHETQVPSDKPITSSLRLNFKLLELIQHQQAVKQELRKDEKKPVGPIDRTDGMVLWGVFCV